ncbi:MAG: L,D-transpeptidase family protein [Rhizobiales bacterium]|nr:L,D-transpeptidase family protein [Hyphomicrobiales bacterium]
MILFASPWRQTLFAGFAFVCLTDTPQAQTVQAPAAPAPTTAVPSAGPSSGFATNPPLAPTLGPAPLVDPRAAPQAGAPSAAPAPVAAKPKPKPAPPRETALSRDPRPSLQPETFYTTAKAAERYRVIAENGGWPNVTAVAPGANGRAVMLLRQRLAIEGDLPAGQESGDQWDNALTAAVKSYQARLGLRQSGIVGGATLKALNVPAATRHRQLASSAERIAASTFAFGPKYIVVNIPSASVEAVEDDRVVRRYVAVVGDVKNPSPEVTTRVVAVNLNPTWTVPTSIIKKEIIPKMRKDPGYLSRAKIRILDSTGQEIDPATIDWNTERAAGFTLRQDSGAHNALGAIRINMPNAHAVYMHDTPTKHSFARDYRFLSHGCVRVEGVYDLAAWILDGSNSRVTKDMLTERQKSGERVDLRPPQPVPVVWIYMTGWASADGVVHFRDDVYGLDKMTYASANELTPPAPASTGR